MTHLLYLSIISANDLRHGRVIYLDKSGNWTHELSQAALAHSEQQAQSLLLAAQQMKQAVNPYLVEVTLGEDAVPRPIHLREIHRGHGPTVGPAAA